MTQMDKIPPMFEGLAGEDVRKWLTTMRAELERRSVPRTEWVSTATIFLGNRVRQILEEAKAAFEWDGQWESFTCVLESTFNDQIKETNTQLAQVNVDANAPELLKADTSQNDDVVADDSESPNDDPPPYNPNAGGARGGGGGGGPGGGGGDPRSAFRRFREDHPIAATATAVGLAVAAPIAAPFALVGALNAVGFGAGGVVAGSIAAGVQSMFYGGAVASGSMFAIAQSIGAGGAALATVGRAVSVGAGALGVLGVAQVVPRRGPAA